MPSAIDVELRGIFDMTLFEIGAEFLKLFDEETGEILDMEALEKLENQEGQKLRNIICLYKKLTAEAEALREAELSLNKRRKAKENSAQRLLEYMDKYMEGNDFECTEGKLSHRKSTKTECIDEMAFLEWSDRWKYGESKFEPKKKEIGEAIKNGETIPGWSRVDYMNASIK